MRFVAWGPHDLDGRLAARLRVRPGGRVQVVRSVWYKIEPDRDGSRRLNDILYVLRDGRVTEHSVKNEWGDRWLAEAGR